MRRPHVVLLLTILLVAAVLRFHRLGHSPPGLHVDEAANVWNAWCLVETGRDAAGARWPVFTFRSFGENRSTLMLYALLPVEALAGPSVAAARGVGAAAGVAAVLCLFLVGRRLFDVPTGLAAAALLAISPWHVQQSRWAHEATLVPLLVLGPLALALGAGLPFADGEHPPRPHVALLAGLAFGVACFGYPAARVFLPVFFAALFVLAARRWRTFLGRPGGAPALGAFVLGAALTFGPLVVRHLTDPAIGKRGATTWVWEGSDGFSTRAAKALSRYPGHFAPGFVFERGDPRIDLSPPPGYGLFPWWAAALLLAGLAGAVVRARRSASARVLLASLALYPAADLLNRYDGVSLLRSLPGLSFLVLLAGAGAVWAFRWLAARSAAGARIAAAAFSVLAIVQSVRFFSQYFGPHDRQWDKYFAFQKDLLLAGEWLRPRFEAADAVVVTGVEMTHPHIYTLMSLGYSPARWLADGKVIVPGPLPDGSYDHEELVTRFGKVSFLFPGLPLPPAAQNLAGRRTLVIVRPGELGLEKRLRPAFEVRSPRDEPVLWCFEVGPSS
jgi:hypothetical protein